MGWLTIRGLNMCLRGIRRDKAGLGSRLSTAWEMAGLNLHGMMMAALSGKFVGYVTFDTAADGNKAATILAELGTA